MPFAVTTFYKFASLKKRQLPALKKQLIEEAKRLDVEGLLLLAEEGINATIAGSTGAVDDFKAILKSQFGDLVFKDSSAERRPFRRFKVSVRKEIVQLKRPDILPGNQSHLSPAEWDELMAEEDVVLIDVRNWYETRLGSFKNAIDPKTWKFSQFPEWVQKSNIPKDTKVGIFCTGGIRCEKAAVAMEQQGYTNVHQLDGGILNYIEQRPGQNYEGECFVFDHRAAVKQDLTASDRYSLCPHCGNPGDIELACAKCEKVYRMCAECKEAIPVVACSKRCRNELVGTSYQGEKRGLRS